MKAQTLVVIKENCPQNHPCPSVRICPVGALKQNGFQAPTVDMEACIRCGKCTRFCPMNALRLDINLFSMPRQFPVQLHTKPPHLAR